MRDDSISLRERSVWDRVRTMGQAGAIAETMWRLRWLWIIPALAGAVLAGAYALLAPKQWQAAQTLLVRDELIGHLVKPGRFESWEAMKTAQETILEVARNPSVLRRTLERVGPARGAARHDWPSDRDIESLRDRIAINAPNGGELGRTEVILLSVKARTPQRARMLVEELGEQLEAQLRHVRGDRAASMLAESEHAYRVALSRYDQIAEELARYEEQVGADLGELRSLTEQTAPEGQLRRTLAQVMADLLAAQTQLSQLDAQISKLQATARDPLSLVALPGELLAAQPALARLKDGLADAQLRLSSLLGRYSVEHPHSRQAALAIEEIQAQIRHELNTALAALQSQHQLVQRRIDLLAGNKNELESRLNRLAHMRVPYGKLVEQFRQQSEALNRASNEWNQAKALALAAREINLVTRVDEVRVGTRPLGPSGKMVVAGGLFAGLLLGMGLLLLVSDFPSAIPAGSGNARLPASRPATDAPHRASTGMPTGLGAPDGVEPQTVTPMSNAAASAERPLVAEALGNADPTRPLAPVSGKAGVYRQPEPGTSEMDVQPHRASPHAAGSHAARRHLGSLLGEPEAAGTTASSQGDQPSGDFRPMTTTAASTPPTTGRRERPAGPPLGADSTGSASALATAPRVDPSQPQTAAAEIAPPTSCMAVVPWISAPLDQSEAAFRSMLRS